PTHTMRGCVATCTYSRPLSVCIGLGYTLTRISSEPADAWFNGARARIRPVSSSMHRFIELFLLLALPVYADLGPHSIPAVSRAEPCNSPDVNRTPWWLRDREQPRSMEVWQSVDRR